MYMIGLLVGLLLVAILWVGCSDAEKQQPPSTMRPAVTAAVPRQADPARAKIEERLRKLASGPRPSDLAMGAMCYDMAIAFERVEFVCPECSEKTLYAQNEWHAHELSQCRRLVTQIPALDVSLDASQFCAKCNPSIDKPVLSLVVRYPDREQPCRTDGIKPLDLELLKLLLEGKDRYRDIQDRETALQDYLPRLHELLGIPPAKSSVRPK